MGKYKFKIIEDKDLWNDFILNNQDINDFLLSWEWGELNKKEGKEVYRFGVYENELIGVCQVYRKNLFSGFDYLDIERGCLIKRDKENVLKNFFEFINNEIKNKKTVFLRVNLRDEYLFDDFTQPKILTRYHPPLQTVVLDIGGGGDFVLSNMHQKMRYNIRKSMQKNVQVKPVSLDDFYNLLIKTSKRQGIKIFPVSHYKNILEIDSRDLDVKLWGAYVGESLVSGIMNLYFGKTMFYLHGGMDYKYRNYFPSQLLHFEVIKDAYKNGYMFYDLWGVDLNNVDKSWQGITRFKMQFGNIKTLKTINYLTFSDFVYKKAVYFSAFLAKFFKNCL